MPHLPFFLCSCADLDLSILLPLVETHKAPVDVGLRGAGDLVVDHVLDVGDVQAPGRHIRGHQEPVLAGREPVLPIYLAPPPVLAEAGHVLNCHFLHLGWRLLYHSCKV